MTFVLNNKIVCVGKWSIEKQNTRIRREYNRNIRRKRRTKKIRRKT